MNNLVYIFAQPYTFYFFMPNFIFFIYFAIFAINLFFLYFLQYCRGRLGSEAHVARCVARGSRTCKGSFGSTVQKVYEGDPKDPGAYEGPRGSTSQIPTFPVYFMYHLPRLIKEDDSSKRFITNIIQYKFIYSYRIYTV